MPRRSEESLNLRDTVDVAIHIRDLPKEWSIVFRVLCTLKGLTSAQTLIWLLLTHPDVQAEVPQVKELRTKGESKKLTQILNKPRPMSV